MSRPDTLAAELHRLARDIVDVRVRAEGIANGISILVWCPHVNPGGGVRLLLSLLPALARQPGASHVELAAPAGTLSRSALTTLAAAGVSVTELFGEERGGEVWARILEDQGVIYRVHGTRAWTEETIRRLARDRDLVYAPWPHGEPCPEVDRPLVCTIQDATLLDYPEILGGPATADEAANTEGWIRRCAATVVSSQATRANLERLFGDIGRSVRVVHHAIRPSADGDGDGPSDPDEILSALPPRYVVCPTNVSVHKNLDNLILAWSRFDQRSDWPLVVCGHGTSVLGAPDPYASDNWRMTQLAGAVRRSGLRVGSELIALGYVPDAAITPLIAGAAALVMPSLTEGGGSFPVEEALSLGVPVLCSEIPVMLEHLAHRTAPIGWFDPTAPSSILQAVHSLVRDYDERRTSTRAGRADPRPTWDDVARRYLDIFAAASQPENGAIVSDRRSLAL